MHIPEQVRKSWYITEKGSLLSEIPSELATTISGLSVKTIFSMTILKLQSSVLLTASVVHGASALHGPLFHGRYNHSDNQLQRPVTYEKLHGFLLWASMGFLMPIAIIVIRIAKTARERGETRKLEILYYLHVTLQVLAVILASIGSIVSLVKFNNKFSLTHQRLGLCLYIIVWLQPIVGFLRPERGVKSRSFWYFIHWLLGTGGAMLGLLNTYTGFHSYELFNSKSMKTFKILFGIEIAFLGLFYLLQDRWHYLVEQGFLKSKPSAEPLDLVQLPRYENISKSNGNGQSHVSSLEHGNMDLEV